MTSGVPLVFSHENILLQVHVFGMKAGEMKKKTNLRVLSAGFLAVTTNIGGKISYISSEN